MAHNKSTVVGNNQQLIKFLITYFTLYIYIYSYFIKIKTKRIAYSELLFITAALGNRRSLLNNFTVLICAAPMTVKPFCCKKQDFFTARTAFHSFIFIQQPDVCFLCIYWWAYIAFWDYKLWIEAPCNIGEEFQRRREV